MKKILPFLFLALFFNSRPLMAQCSMAPVDLTTRINNSSLVIEGKVVARRSFWNPAGNYIYTSNLIEVNKVLKGSLLSNKLEVITDGGEVGTSKQLVEPSLELTTGDLGVFTLNKVINTPQFGYDVYAPYADMQGFIKYDAHDQSASEPFAKYNHVSSDLYPLLESLLNIKISGSPFANSAGNKGPSASVAAITGFAPTSITAGTATSLTITGTGFGATQGTGIVEFRNADDGGATFVTPHASQYLSWNNTQIVVQVPSRTTSGTLTTSGTAGTGQIRVTTASGSTLSAQTLTVNYGHINVFYSNTLTPVQVFNTRHHGPAAGSMSWQMFTGFDANAAAKASFLRAFQSWRCATYINWTLGATVSTNTIALDGVNVIRFDVGAELPAGVLGRCTSYFNGCIVGSSVFFYVRELDIVFDSGTTWQYGPALASGAQYDFESVALHELGHGHQLTHVINTVDVMHYSIANAQNKRVLNVDDINGGNAVMARNLSGAVCGQTVMTALNSTNCAFAAPTASFNLTSPVCVGATVPLNDISTGGPTSWLWTMPGGTPSTSTLQNTSTTYTAAGTYSVTLVVANGTGTSTPLTKTISVIANPTVNVSGTATLCSGNSTTLTATGTTTYTWMPGSLTGAAQVFTPAVTTVYTVTGSNGTCSGIRTYTVTVNTTPTVSVNSATICTGQTATLTATGATSYTWMPGSLTGSVQTFTPGSSSVYTITGATGSCSNVRTATVTVLASPTVAVSGASAICSGNATTLTASGASTYTWMPGALTGAVQVFTPAVTTIYTVTGSNGSCTNVRTYTVNVAPTPTITVNSASICSGNSATLTATGATSYTWMPGSLSGSVQTLSPASTTVYTITGLSGACSSTRTTNITVTATPTVSISGTSVICSGNSTTLTAAGATTYTWMPGSLTGPVQTVSPASATVYTVTGANGSCTNVRTYTVTVNPSPTITVNSATICSGNPATLTANGATTYTWMPGSLTGSVQTLSPASTTIYTITGATGGCSSTRTTNITVNITPTVTVSGTSVICSGSSATLTATGAGTYTWMPGSMTGSVQVVSPASSLVYTITGANGACTNVRTYTVTVNPSPTITVNSATICAGQTATLTATGATTYTWMPGSLTGSVQSLSPSSTTIYTITGSGGTCTSTRTTAITVNSTPSINISGGSTVCSGNSATLSATGATSYTWNPGALTGSAQVVSPSSTTVYSVTGTNGSCTGSVSYTLTVQASPTLNVVSSSSMICVSQSATLSATGASGYLWYPGTVSGNSVVVSPTATTIYTVQGTTGACSSSQTIALTVSPCTGMSHPVQNNAVRIFPNPASGLITIHFGEMYSGKVCLYNAIGQEIISRSLHETETTSFHIESFAKGVYLIKLISSGGQEKVFKVLKD